MVQRLPTGVLREMLPDERAIKVPRHAFPEVIGRVDTFDRRLARLFAEVLAVGGNRLKSSRRHVERELTQMRTTLDSSQVVERLSPAGTHRAAHKLLHWQCRQRAFRLRLSIHRRGDFADG